MRALGFIFLGGTVFGVGLGVSDLLRQEVVLRFLYLDDLGLLLTMGAAIAVVMPIYKLAVPRLAAPVLGGTFDRFPDKVAQNHIVGGILFGVGWGVAGVCPGAALASLGAGNYPMLAGLAGMLAGAYLQGVVAESSPGARTASPGCS